MLQQLLPPISLTEVCAVYFQYLQSFKEKCIFTGFNSALTFASEAE